MRVRTMKDLGAAIRSRRKALGVDQATLAARVGVGREWIIDAEKGKPGVAAGLVTRTLEALELSLEIVEPAQHKPRAKLDTPTVDIDLIVARARESKR